MYHTHVGIVALTGALCISALGSSSASANPPLVATTDRPYARGDETRRRAWNEGRDETSNAGVQREIQILKLLGRPEVVKELNLSPDQVQALKTALEDLTRRCAEAIGKLETSLTRQVELLKQDNPDAGALDEAVEVSGRLRTELAKLRMQHLVLVLKTIDQEQRRKLNALLRESGERFKGGGDKGRRERIKKMLSDRRDVDANSNAPAKQP